jgi:hypothetical protein
MSWETYLKTIAIGDIENDFTIPTSQPSLQRRASDNDTRLIWKTLAFLKAPM